MALEADDTETIEQNIRQVLTNCTLTDIDVDKLPIIDVEFYFLNLRARSVGEIVNNKYKCNNLVSDRECGNIMETEINLLDIKVEQSENTKDEFQLTPEISIKLKYPQFSIVKRATASNNAADMALDMIASSIEHIYDGEQYYYASETPIKELVEWIESLNQEQFSKIEEFFNNQPKLNRKIELKCGKCGFNHNIEIEGLESFFG